MKVQRITEKLITDKYKMRAVGVDPRDYLHDQNEKLARIINRLKDKPADELFDYLERFIEPREVRNKINDMRTPENEAELANELLSKYKSTLKRALKEYSYQPYMAYDVLRNCVVYNNGINNMDIEKQAIAFGLEEYVKKYGLEQSNLDFCDILEYEGEGQYSCPSYNFELLDKQRVRAEDIGKPETSSVHNSSFSTYYYYKVKVRILNDIFEGLVTLSSYYSGGWN